jgi:hypothetical protein
LTGRGTSAGTFTSIPAGYNDKQGHFVIVIFVSQGGFLACIGRIWNYEVDYEVQVEVRNDQRFADEPGHLDRRSLDSATD